MNKEVPIRKQVYLSRSLTRISIEERVLFSKHLAMILRSGISTLEGLKLIRSQVKSRNFKRILQEAIQKVENGHTLSDALATNVRAFGELFINIINLGEMTGTLSDNLNFLANELRKSKQLRSKVMGALVYPIILLFATAGIVGVLVFLIVPKIMPIFVSLKAELPLTTRILIASADFLKNNYVLVLVGGVLLVIGFILSSNIPKIKKFYQLLLLGIPIAGHVYLNYMSANITRTLGLLLKSGFKIVEAVNTTAASISSLPHKEALLELAIGIQRGEAMGDVLGRHERLFPATFQRMVEVGERTGNLEPNLTYLSEFYEDEVDYALRTLSSTIEPVMLVLMGGIVAFVAVSIISPIYQVTQTLSR